MGVSLLFLLLEQLALLLFHFLSRFQEVGTASL